MRKGLIFSATLAAVALMSAGAGASTQRASTVDVSTRAKALEYLVSLGIDPAGVVVQRGAHNYAGPSCPGRGWSCTTATRVLQIATRAGDTNTFVCTGGSSSGPGDCTIFQFSSGGDNNATCTEKLRASAASESCRIEQQNTTGANRIVITQFATAANGASQGASQYAGTDQNNTSGLNDVQVNQQIHQSTSDTDASGGQSQDGTQQVSATQSSDSGNNSATIAQSLAEASQAQGSPTATITQNQNTDGNLNTSAAVTQNSNSGKNTAQVNQSNDLNQYVNSAAIATQTQGSPTGGLAMFFNQSSSGLSTINGQQLEKQVQSVGQVGNLTQTQFGPMWGDPTQGSNSSDTYAIGQNSEEHASSPSANQDDAGYGQCFTTGNCNINQHINVQGNVQGNSCSGHSCDIGLIVGHNSDGSFSSNCGTNSDSGSCNVNFPNPPPPPFTDGG